MLEERSATETTLAQAVKTARMVPKVIIKQQHRGSTLKLLFFVVNKTFDFLASIITEPMYVDDLAIIRFKFSGGALTPRMLSSEVSVKTSEAACASKQAAVKIYMDKVEKQLPCSNNWSEFTELPNTSPDFDFVLGSSEICGYTVEVNVVVQDVTDRLQPFENLYADKMCMDIQLCATEGPSSPVDMHKVVIVQHSELFRDMLSDPDMRHERQIPIKGVTAQDLEQMREYMYKGTLPLAVKGLPQLLLLAIHGRMKQLKNDCIRKVVTVVTGDDLDELVAFAIKFNIPELIHAILSNTPDRVIHEAHMKRKNKLQFTTRNFSQLSLKH